MEKYFLTCHFKKYLGFPCPGCGIQRSFQKLLEGDLYGSFILYPALIPIILTLVYLYYHLIHNKRNGAKLLLLLVLFDLSLVIINYIIVLYNFFN